MAAAQTSEEREMERFMYVLICIVAISALAMIIMVIVAVLKVASQQDDDYELSERISFQAKEGLRNRGNEAYRENDHSTRQDYEHEGMGERDRDPVRNDIFP